MQFATKLIAFAQLHKQRAPRVTRREGGEGRGGGEMTNGERQRELVRSLMEFPSELLRKLKSNTKIRILVWIMVTLQPEEAR